MAILNKIAGIRDGLKVEKTGYDERSEFRFFRSEDVANAVRASMAEHGVVNRTIIREWSEDSKWDSNGRNRPRHTIVADVVFTDIEDGTEYVTSVIATGSDTGSDRGPRKAMTQAFKEACIDVFIITEEMEKFDSDSSPESEPINMTPPTPEAADIGKITNTIGALVRDGEHPLTGKMVTLIGARIAKENGIGEEQIEWKNNLQVMTGVLKAIENGEVE